MSDNTYIVIKNYNIAIIKIAEVNGYNENVKK